jgi:ArsR family transcriptional regulator
MTAPTLLFDRLTALADLTRSRMLLLLERHELTVGELASVLQLPQSSTSRHLKTLADEGWVSSRAEGTVRWYRMVSDRLDPSARRLWQVVREQVVDASVTAHDEQRLRSVLAQRRAKSQEFFSSAAGQWDRMRAELFGAHPEQIGLLALLDEEWTVGDLGCGTGQLAATLAPFVRRVIAVDDSKAMLAAARKRLQSVENVELRKGDIESLPVTDGELDVAVLSLVLHYMVDPAQGLIEARRVIRPRGRLLIVDMMPHDRDEYRQQMGHVWQGFSREQLTGWLRAAGFTHVTHRPIPPDPEAKGPALFALTAR